MAEVFAIQGLVGLLLWFGLLAVAIFAFISSLTYSAEAYSAAGKWTKQGWTIVLGISAALPLLSLGLGIGLPFFISLAFIIASLVFLADVRPALSGLRRR